MTTFRHAAETKVTHPISSNPALAPRPDKGQRQDALGERTATPAAPADRAATGARTPDPGAALLAPRDAPGPPARLLAGAQDARAALAALRQALADDPAAARAAHGAPDRAATATLLAATGF